ncbi:MAG: AI-2E family transporter, partial [Spirochaetota bacterium]
MEGPRIRVIEIFFLLIVVSLSYGFFLVMRPFVLDIFLAAVFTSVLFPFYDRVSRRVGGRKALASFMVVTLVFFFVTIPVTFIGILVYSEAISGYNAVVAQAPRLAERLSEITLLDWAGDIPIVGDYLKEIGSVELSEAFRDAGRAGSNFVLSATQRSFVSASAALVNFLLILLLMFFFFRTGRHLLMSVYNVAPMPNRELREIARETR